MADRLTFLVVDCNADSRHLLARTLLRKYPGAEVQEADELDAALGVVARCPLSAIISHRTFDLSCAELAARLREAAADVPIIVMSGIDRTSEALRAGANAFLLADEWLRLGTLVEELLKRREASNDAGSSPAQV